MSQKNLYKQCSTRYTKMVQQKKRARIIKFAHIPKTDALVRPHYLRELPGDILKKNWNFESAVIVPKEFMIIYIYVYNNSVEFILPPKNWFSDFGSEAFLYTQKPILIYSCGSYNL